MAVEDTSMQVCSTGWGLGAFFQVQLSTQATHDLQRPKATGPLGLKLISWDRVEMKGQGGRPLVHRAMLL